MATTTTSYTVKVMIIYEPKQGRLIPGEIGFDDEKTEEAFAKEVLQKHRLDHCTLHNFEVAVLIKKKTKMIAGVAYRVLIKLDEKCQQRDIGNIVRQQFSGYTDTSITIKGLKVDLTGKVTYLRETIEEKGPFFDTQIYFKEIIVHVPKAFQTRIYFISEFILCPYILLNISQYNLLMHEVNVSENREDISTITQFTRVADGFYAMTENSIAVCVDTYFGLYNKSGKQPAFSDYAHFSLVMATYLLGGI